MRSLDQIRNLLDEIDTTPFGQVNLKLDKIATITSNATRQAAAVEKALEKICDAIHPNTGGTQGSVRKVAAAALEIARAAS